MGKGTFMSLKGIYIPNFSLLKSLEPSEKFLVVSVGGGDVKTYFSEERIHRIYRKTK